MLKYGPEFFPLNTDQRLLFLHAEITEEVCSCQSKLTQNALCNEMLEHLKMQDLLMSTFSVVEELDDVRQGCSSNKKQKRAKSKFRVTWK